MKDALIWMLQCKFQFAMAVLLCGLSSWHPDSLSIEEADIVVTDYDPVYFSGNSPQTYFMPDSVGTLGDLDINPLFLTDEEEEFILEQVARNMEMLGYERVEEIDENSPPDLVLFVNRLVEEFRGGTCIPWWPGWGWWPWPPDWGWGPGYCYPSYVYSYTTGTLTIDMIPPLEVAPSQQSELRRVWSAGLNGILRSNVECNQQFIRNGIDKAFALSPYLAQEFRQMQ